MTSQAKRTIVLCSCEDTMPLDTSAVTRGCPDRRIETARQLCRSELARFRALAADGAMTVACTQEAPLFREIAEDEGLKARLSFANVRETGGWSTSAKAAGPKMAAILAAAEIEIPPSVAVPLESQGVALIIGRDERAVEIASRLAGRLDVTVVIGGPAEITPPRTRDFPICRGRVRGATGHLGAFSITFDGFAMPTPSSRRTLAFGQARDAAVSKADILIDLTGGTALFPAADLRPGYLRADPDDAVGVERLIGTARDLVGTFDKPRFITFREDLCVHSRSRITGCRRCLDLCPAGAIEPAGNHVKIDPAICAGCGQCAAACPTGAAAYALPAVDVLLRQIRAMLQAYRRAGGTQALLLLHDGDHGAEMIDAAARLGDGLPAHVLPLAINEVTQVGLEAIAAAIAGGAVAVRLLTRSKPRHDTAGLMATIALAETLTAGLGYGAGLVRVLAADDPDEMVRELATAPLGRVPTAPSTFEPLGSKRDVLRLALRELHRVAPSPIETIALPKGAVFGRVNVATEGCTLCLACVAACPTSALSDNAEKPQLKFDESLCVQCGLCQATCPEKVITLEPRLSFAAFEAPAIVIKEEEPFCCAKCAKPFGVKSTIERIIGKLQGQHWMFSGEHAKRLELLKMCDDCRIETVTNQGFDPYAAGKRAAARTTEDYLKERDEAARAAAMKARIERGEA